MHLNFLVKSPTFRILFGKSAEFPSTLIISRYNIIFTCACSLYSSKILKQGKFWESRFIGYLKLFSVCTKYSMCAVLYSVIVSERLKMRKSPAINYWQDTVSGLEVNRNVRNINKLWGILTSFVILYYFSLYYYFFFNS